MKLLIILIIIVLAIIFAYFFPKGVKIFGIPADIFFSKDKSENEDFK